MNNVEILILTLGSIAIIGGIAGYYLDKPKKPRKSKPISIKGSALKAEDLSETLKHVTFSPVSLKLYIPNKKKKKTRRTKRGK